MDIFALADKFGPHGRVCLRLSFRLSKFHFYDLFFELCDRFNRMMPIVIFPIYNSGGSRMVSSAKS